MGFFERQGALGGLEIATGLIGGGQIDAGEDDPGVAREGLEPEFLGTLVLAVEVGAVGGFEAFGEAAGFPVGGFVTGAFEVFCLGFSQEPRFNREYCSKKIKPWAGGCRPRA